MKKKSDIFFKSEYLFAMALFGSLGVFKRFIPLPNGILVVARGLLGSAFILLFCLATGRKVNWNHLLSNKWPLLLMGVTEALNWIPLYIAMDYTSVAVVTLIYYMGPIIAILLSPFIFKESISKKKWICIAATLTGVFLVSGIFTSGRNIGQFTGVIIAVFASFAQAAMIIENRKFCDFDPYDKSIVQLFLTLIVTVPYTLIAEDLTGLSFSLKTLVLLFILGVVITGVAHITQFDAVPHMSAQTLSLFAYIDPITATLCSAIILSEPAGIYEIAGAILIIGSAILSEIKTEK